VFLIYISHFKLPDLSLWFKILRCFSPPLLVYLDTEMFLYNRCRNILATISIFVLHVFNIHITLIMLK